MSEITGGAGAPWTESLEQAITASAFINVAHGLAVKPAEVEYFLVCKVAEAGYAPDDRVYPWNQSSDTVSSGLVVSADAVHITGSFSGSHSVIPKGGGSHASITVANWRIVFRWRNRPLPIGGGAPGGGGGGGGGDPVKIPAAQGTILGDLTNTPPDAGGIGAAFDDIIVQNTVSSARTVGNVTTGWVGKDWGVGNTEQLTQLIATAPSDSGFNEGVGTVTLYAEGDDNPAFPSPFVLGSTAPFADAAGLSKIIACSGGGFRNSRLRINSVSAQKKGCAECEFFN